uniref:FPL domain-containing protein n=1 Tax=Tetraselmis sp. GSL018 TaxID=582737 RepID=A0A061S3S3_9CHLO
MIWGDQHEPRFFEFFLEKHLLKQFRRILSQPGARTGNVAQQVLQTLSIMIQNIRNETSIYFLFSNNQINEMISIKLDFEDEEVLGYYISFLKAIALKFNEQTVQLFLIMDGTDDKLPTSFPLYTEALKLFRHKESMVRAAVRTLTLSVYSIRDELVRNFVLSPPASNYFRHLAMYLTEQCQLLDGTLMSAEASSASFSTDALDNILAEVEDVLVYTNDVLATGCQRVSAMMAVNFWQHFLVPCCFAPLARGLDSSSYSDPASAWIGEVHAGPNGPRGREGREGGREGEQPAALPADDTQGAQRHRLPAQPHVVRAGPSGGGSGAPGVCGDTERLAEHRRHGCRGAPPL